MCCTLIWVGIEQCNQLSGCEACVVAADIVSPSWQQLSIVSKELKLEDEGNTKYQNLCGTKMFVISYLGLLSGLLELGKKILGKATGKTVGDCWQITAQVDGEGKA